MKSLVVFSFLIMAVTALDQEFIEEFMEKMLKIGEVCSKEVGATTEDISELMAHTIPTAHTGKCLIFCFHKHFNVQKEDGSVDKVGAIQSLEPLRAADVELYKKAIEVFKVCGEKVVPDSDPCITAANLAACGIEEGKARGMDDSLLG